MKRARLFFSILSLLACQSRRPTEVMLHTSLGDIRVRLYDSTPRHRDNFLKLAEAGFYDSLAFHRIVRDVAVQGGDPTTRATQHPATDTADGPGYTLPAEIKTLPRRGALCAVRSGSGQSHGSQFFLVPGFSFTPESMTQYEKKAGVTLSEASRRVYIEQGGVPWLEGQVTVFGEVVQGIEVVDRIAALPRDEQGRPLRTVWFFVEIDGN